METYHLLSWGLYDEEEEGWHWHSTSATSELSDLGQVTELCLSSSVNGVDNCPNTKGSLEDCGLGLAWGVEFKTEFCS